MNRNKQVSLTSICLWGARQRRWSRSLASLTPRRLVFGYDTVGRCDLALGFGVPLLDKGAVLRQVAQTKLEKKLQDDLKKAGRVNTSWSMGTLKQSGLRIGSG